MAVMTSAQLGLDCSGTTGEAYLVPHYNGRTKCMEATFIQGYKGKIHLITREGGVTKIEARLVHEKDEIEISYGTKPIIKHKPYILEDPGKIIGAYAVATLPNGMTQFDHMRMDEIETIKDDALKKTRGYGPWKDHEPEMIRKTPVHRLCKNLPLPSKVKQELAMDGSWELDQTYERPAKKLNEAEILMEKLKADKRREEFEKEVSSVPPVVPRDPQVDADIAREAREKENHEKALRGESPTPPPPREAEPHGVTGDMIEQAEQQVELDKDAQMDTMSEKEPTEEEWSEIEREIKK